MSRACFSFHVSLCTAYVVCHNGPGNNHNYYNRIDYKAFNFEVRRFVRVNLTVVKIFQ